ncbi:restriction endonuclease subunit S [Micromonospora sp. DT31]|uniref:restriction endonuclease subunit S n=1 Tax=Micromonospora sp. DT31 TaxID=3393434 RepID=UPI003CF8599D
MTEPFRVPASWRWTTFGEVAYVASNLVDPADFPAVPHIAPNHIESGSGRLLPYRTVAEDGVTSPKHRFFAGQLLYSKIRPYLSKVVDVNFDGLCSADMYPIDCSIDRRFLFHWMLTAEFTQAAAARQARTVLPKINERALSQLPVPVPPLAEQCRIVAALERRLSHVTAGRINLERGSIRLHNLTRSLRQSAVLGGVGVDRGLPAGWRWGMLGDVVASVEAGQSFSCHPRPARPDEWGVIKVSAMTWGEFRPDENKAVPEGRVIDFANQIHSGDILVSRANTSAYVGAPVMVGMLRQRLLLSDKSLRLRVNSEVDKDWLLHLLASPFVRRQISAKATGTKDSMRNISQRALLEIRIPIPRAVDQTRIAAETSFQLKMVDRLRGDVASAARRGEKLRKALLSAAFTGQLVPQDRNDEPASALLARVRAERGATPPKRRARSLRATKGLPAPPTRVTGDNYQQEALPL